LRDLEATPYEQCAAHETQATVRRALAALPAVFRSVVILRDLEGLSYEEIAEVVEVSVGTVKSRILRGRRMLKDILDPVLRSTRTQTGHATSRRNSGSDPEQRAHSATHGTHQVYDDEATILKQAHGAGS
jgi:RNA polymerase sigma-70 factor (ECF subfamily)